MEKIDLHTHSTFSDGTLTPTELIALAKRENIRAVALTDHDNILGLSQAAKAASYHELEFIPGIELAAKYKNTEIHILGLMIDYETSPLYENLPEIMNIRHNRNSEILRLLNKEGIFIEYDDLTTNNSSAAITRAHFAKAILDKGYCKTKNEAFEKYLMPGCKTYVSRDFLSTARGIELINNSGGVAILAHATRYRLDFSEIEEMVKLMVLQGLKGLECYYSTFTNHEHNMMVKMAKKYRLCMSGGSDFHGDIKPHISIGTGLGNLFVPYQVLSELKNRNN